jgi:hypothetical protein
MSKEEKAFDCDGWIARLKHSNTPELKRHLLLGTSLFTGESILFPEDVLREHRWIIGSSGGRQLGVTVADCDPLIGDQRSLIEPTKD